MITLPPSAPGAGSFPALISKSIRIVAHTIDTKPSEPENTITSIDVFNHHGVLLGHVRPAVRPGWWIGTTRHDTDPPSPELSSYGDAVRWVDVMDHRYDQPSHRATHVTRAHTERTTPHRNADGYADYDGRQVQVKP